MIQVEMQNRVGAINLMVDAAALGIADFFIAAMSQYEEFQSELSTSVDPGWRKVEVAIVFS